MRERNNTSLQYVIYMFRKKELQDNTSNQFMREAKYTRNSDVHTSSFHFTMPYFLRISVQ